MLKRLGSKNGWIRTETARNLNFGMSRNRFCDFLADPDSRNFSRFYTNILAGAGTVAGDKTGQKGSQSRPQASSASSTAAPNRHYFLSAFPMFVPSLSW
jgi:hypothetical protein